MGPLSGGNTSATTALAQGACLYPRNATDVARLEELIQIVSG
jgi:hypothetical protein